MSATGVRAALTTAGLCAALLSSTSCAGSCGHFALSLATDDGGQASPVAAAEDYARRGNGELPGTGWKETGRDANGVTLRSGRATLHATRGSDGTWFVDSGSSC